MNQNEPNRSNATHNQQQHVRNQADFDNSFINRRDFIYLEISKMSFTF